MTTYYEASVECAVCGAESRHTAIGSTNEMGAPDLDMRPSEMQRSTIFAWVQRCPDCGYCASNLSEAPPQASELVKSALYKEQLGDPSFSELTNGFICQALIHEATGDYAMAAWALVHAAWTCDDEQQTLPARELRSRAADAAIQARGRGQEFAERDGSDAAILVDLLRRAERSAEASQLIENERPGIPNEIVLNILAFQEKLLAKGDAGIHTIDEAVQTTD